MTSHEINSMTLDQAQSIIAAAKTRAAELELSVTVAVVDAGGWLVALERQDGASMLSIDVARGKAYTAVVSGFNTGDFADFIQTEPTLAAGIPALPGLVVFGGGLQITSEGRLLGGVGVSGGHFSQDIDIATAGLGAVAT